MSARPHASDGSDLGEPREARDVMAFGQEVGRVLSDGRVVGRAETYAKVFPSSRAVKRAVGPVAWLILEDIALDARLDDGGRLVADTNVRRIAANLGLNKETVTRHLIRLRDHELVELIKLRAGDSGRWESCRYEVKPTACVERFTHTPAANKAAGQPPRTEKPDTVKPDTGATGHGSHRTRVQPDTGEPVRPKEEKHVVLQDLAEGQQTRAGARELTAELERLGVAQDVAAELVASHPPERLREAIEAATSQSVRNPAAWVATALREGWDFSGRLAELRAVQARSQLQAQQEAAERQAAHARQQQEQRAAGWAAAVSAALDDDALHLALERVSTPAPLLGRRLVPLARAQLLAWAVAAHAADPARPLAEVLHAQLRPGTAPAPDLNAGAELPQPPPVEASASDLSARIAACLQRLPHDGDGRGP